MRLFTNLCLWLLVMQGSFAQHVVQGKVTDTHKNALPFCSIQLMGTANGCISNEDGTFILKYNNITDTFCISHLAYKPKFVTVSQVLAQPLIQLEPDVYELALTEIKPNDAYWYKLVYLSKTLAMESAQTVSKAWFSLESSSMGSPIEVMESYHNVHLEQNMVNSLTLKCGRIAHDTAQHFAFVSLNPTRLITAYKLFYQNPYPLPINPLQLSLNQLKKRYHIHLLNKFGENGTIYHLSLQPKNKERELFAAELWIDSSTQQLLHCVLKRKQVFRHPFIPIQASHHIDSVNMRLAYNFVVVAGEPTLNYIDLTYTMLYDYTRKCQQIATNAMLYLFEHGQTYFEPIFEASPEMSDYEAILLYPFNKLFWQRNEAVTLSSKKKSYLNYFQTHGLLVNFDGFEKGQPVSERTKLVWTAQKRFTTEDFKQFKPKNYVNARKQRVVFESPSTTKLFNLSAQLFMDVNSYTDTTDILTATLIDLDKSYYNAAKHPLSEAFINTYFDLYEIQRRKLVAALKHNKNCPDDAKRLFKTHNLELLEISKRYLREVERGRNHPKMKVWDQVVYESLGFSNLSE